MDLKSENKGMVEGVVLESRVDIGRGRLCSGLIQRGALRKSSILVAGTAWAKVNIIFCFFYDSICLMWFRQPNERNLN